MTGGSADKPRERPGWSRPLGTVALGALIGIAGSQLLPVADTLAEALGETGLGPHAVQAIILCLSAVGGIEGALLLRPLVRYSAGCEEPAR